MSLYSDLGLAAGASADAIKKAFRKKASEAHPDRKGGDTAKFQVIQRAYAILGDDEARKRYDETGETDSAPSLRKQAIQQLCSIVQSIIESADDLRYTKITYEAEKRILAGIKQSKDAIKEQERRVAKINLVVKKLKRKAGASEHDFLAAMLNNTLKALEAQITSIKQVIEIGEEMQVLLKDYDYEAEVYTGQSSASLQGLSSLGQGFFR